MYPLTLDRHTVTGLVIASGLALLTIVFYSNIAAYYEIWTAENSIYSHGLLLLPISTILLYREWRIIGHHVSIRFRPFTTLLLVSLSAIWLIFEIAHIQILSQITFILILCFYIFSLIGFKSSLRLAFPILIILTATPVWSIFSQPLQEPTAFAVNEILKLTGYTSFQEGFLIYIPEGIFEVGSTCSGLRFQIAAITATTLYVYTVRYSFLKSLVYIVSSSLVALISNIIRIYIVVLSGHYTNMTHSLLEDHIWLGWLVFFCSFTIFIILTGLYESRVNNDISEAAIEVIDNKFSDFIHNKSSLLLFFVICSASIGPFANWVFFSPSIDTEKRSINFNHKIQGWNISKNNRNWIPVWLPSDFELLSSYSSSSRKVDLFISTYFQQEQGREIINDMNNSFDNKIWKIIDSNFNTVTINDGRTIPIFEEVITNAQQSKRIIWKLYYVGGMYSNKPLTAVLHNVLSRFKGRTDATVLLISTQDNLDIEDMRTTLKLFLNDSVGEFEKQLNSMFISN